MTQQGSQRALHAAQILWPAFLAAAVLEMVVFSWIDPGAVRWGSWQPDDQTVYSLTFFIFWAAITLASLISHWMMEIDALQQNADREAGETRPPRPASNRRPSGAQRRQVQQRHA